MRRRRDDSQFVYPRSLVRDVADCLASVRASTWCDEQRLILDQFITTLCDDLGANDPSFDTDAFCTRAKFQLDRLAIHTEGEPPWPTAPSPSSGT